MSPQKPKKPRTKKNQKNPGRSGQGNSPHIPCNVHGLSSVHQQTWNWLHEDVLVSVRSYIGVLWQTALVFSSSQHHWLAQTPLIGLVHSPGHCLYLSCFFCLPYYQILRKCSINAVLRLVVIFPIFLKKENCKKKVVCRKFRQTTQHGALEGKTQSKDVKYYNLDVIISGGYRVKKRFKGSCSVSFGHRIRLLQPSDSSPSATAFDSFSHRSRMCQLNEVDEVVKWSGWVRIMKFMISAQLSIHAKGKAKSGLLLPLWFLYENVFSVFIATSITNAFNSLNISE